MYDDYDPMERDDRTVEQAVQAVRDQVDGDTAVDGDRWSPDSGPVRWRSRTSTGGAR